MRYRYRKPATGIEWLVFAATAIMVAALTYAGWVEARGWAVKSGVVGSKEYYPAWVEYNHSSTGNGGSVSIPVTHPEKYIVVVVGEIDGGGEVMSRILRVDQITYHAVRIGQKWTQKGGFEP